MKGWSLHGDLHASGGPSGPSSSQTAGETIYGFSRTLRAFSSFRSKIL
jgi:hypothetical protein